MIIKEFSKERAYFDQILIEGQGIIYICYQCRSKRILSLYAEAYDNGTLLYDGQWTDFPLDVYSIQVDKMYEGKIVNTIEFLTGTTKKTISAAFCAIKRHRFDTADDMSRIDIALDKEGIPYLIGLPAEARTFARSKIKFNRRDLKPVMISKTFKLNIGSHDELLRAMLEAATTR